MSGIRHTISISKLGEKHEQIHAATMFKILMALFTRQNQFTEQEQWGKKTKSLAEQEVESVSAKKWSSKTSLTMSIN